MRHLMKGRKLNRNQTHRTAMFRNMCCSLLAHERITTTTAKAKELRTYVEPLITLAKKAAAASDAAADAKDDEEKQKQSLKSLHYRRMIISRLGGNHAVPLDEETEVRVVGKLVEELGVRYANRPGGYTRVLKLATRRLGDAAETAIIELVDGKPRVQETVADDEDAVAPTVEDDAE